MTQLITKDQVQGCMFYAGPKQIGLRLDRTGPKRAKANALVAKSKQPQGIP
ncbi:hypothetical protein HJC10_31770 [Corallococcus exiguus]|uniref:hypothetical protein n=1 Tax=Corallococcus TaxID=83461 RepID=UPI0013158265|nr:MULTISPECIES: hypothetical protein [Corallococcus]NNB90829.1 hypothetical protein [Corallococcus exiguus]NNB98605.1 hypothetical protein [Corallococcus exiguus]NNC07410.1 hypothetical protein [Corallococcus exiguus]NPC50330.1 hypothetical protein [Corallococcus exiguus]